MTGQSDNTQTAEDPARRTMMAWGMWALLGVMLAGAAAPLVELAARKGRGKRLTYIPALSVHDMPEVGVMKAELTLRGGDRPDTRVFVRRDAADELTAFSAICTHLGCLVSFNRLSNEFLCPCHGGKYDIDGKPIAGPPPRPLERLPVRVEGEEIQVGFHV